MGSVVFLGSMLENSGPGVSLAADHMGSLCWHTPEFQAPEGWAGVLEGLARSMQEALPPSVGLTEAPWT